MSHVLSLPADAPVRVFAKETLVKGQPKRIDCLDIGGQTFSISRGPATVIALEDEWYEDLQDPEAVIANLRNQRTAPADILTFWQRLPDLAPRYAFYREWEEIAVLEANYDRWFNHAIKSRVRNQIRKAEKEGVVVRLTNYDDEFVRGMTAIFNETPVRQGRRFWHYGKDFATVKRQFSRYVYREHMLAAYFNDEMIGFIMLGNAGTFGITGQIISSVKHRDKGTNNALIAKAVDVCEKAGLQHLVYLFWSEDSLSEFKRRCGFEKTLVPRYYVPLTARGRMALKLGAHKGWKALLPDRVKASLKQVRASWYERSCQE